MLDTINIAISAAPVAADKYFQYKYAIFFFTGYHRSPSPLSSSLSSHDSVSSKSSKTNKSISQTIKGENLSGTYSTSTTNITAMPISYYYLLLLSSLFSALSIGLNFVRHNNHSNNGRVIMVKDGD